MYTRRNFIKTTGLATAGLLLSDLAFAQKASVNYPSLRPVLNQRKFVSELIENKIAEMKSKIADPQLFWLFQNCFPNTLDTTVEYETINGKPDTYVITGDIDAMWLRDSTAQVWPYLPFILKDEKLKQLIQGVIHRQTKNILLDPYANAFYKDASKISEWKSDHTEMKAGIHERKWEIDSLCYPVRLAYEYWKLTGDSGIFDQNWILSAKLILKTFKEQQRFDGQGPYHFQRTTAWATDGVPLSGWGYPVKPNGLICSVFRPSDDCTLFPYLIPSNMFAVEILGYLYEICSTNEINQPAIAQEANNLRKQVKEAIEKYAFIKHPDFGDIIPYEINGFGSYNLMDDGNVPSLLSLPYLACVSADNERYKNTRAYILSENNPFFFKGKAAEGIGSPHTGTHTIWPMSIVMRGLTSSDEKEIEKCLQMLVNTHAGTGFMHESFHKDDASKFTRKWFAWANTLFGEFVLKIEKEHPELLKKQYS